MASQNLLATKPWECMIPVKCSWLEGDGISLAGTGSDSVKPVYFRVPRQSYLFLCTSIIEVELGSILKEKNHEDDYFYFTYEGIPGYGKPFYIPWQYPMGVILDVIRSLASPESNFDPYDHFPLELQLRRFEVQASSTVEAVPVPVDVEHDTHTLPVWPMSLLGIQKNGLLTIKSMIKSCLSRQYGIGAVKTFLGMEVAVINALEQSIRDNEPRSYYQTLHKIRAKCAAETSRSGCGDLAPVKFHCAGKTIPVILNINECPSVGFALYENFPCCYDLTFQECTSAVKVPAEYAKVYISGSQPVLCTPISALMEDLCSVDSYLHIVVVPTRSNEPRDRPKMREPTQEGVGVWDAEDDASPKAHGHRLRSTTSAAARGRPTSMRKGESEMSLTTPRTPGEASAFSDSVTGGNFSGSTPNGSQLPARNSSVDSMSGVRNQSFERDGASPDKNREVSPAGSAPATSNTATPQAAAITPPPSAGVAAAGDSPEASPVQPEAPPAESFPEAAAPEPAVEAASGSEPQAAPEE